MKLWMILLLSVISTESFSKSKSIDVKTEHGVERLHYQELNGLAVMEGDIVLGEVKDVDEIKKGTGLPPWRIFLWKDRTIPYVIEDDVPKKERIHQAIEHIHSATNFKLVPRTDETHYLKFVKWDEDYVCQSHLGRTFFMQKIWVGEHCTYGTIIHEIGHTLGLKHEQTRSDRDQYVKIHWKNIEPKNKSNFKKRWYAVDYGEFDFDSIMLYGPYSFSIDDKKPTITLKDGSIYYVNRYMLSAGDIDTLNMMYKNIDPAE